MGKIYTLQKGKLSREDDVYMRRHGDHDISVKRKEGFQYTRSEEQGQNRAAFGVRSAQVAAWRRANSTPPSPEYLRLLKHYEIQKKNTPKRYLSFWHYLIANLTICD